MHKIEHKKPLIIADLPWWPHNAYGIIDTSAFYVMNEDGYTDAQVAKWLKVAVTMAQPLQGKN